MGADLTKPFGESCCDGGAASNANSAQACGCDPGAGWTCAVHEQEQEAFFAGYHATWTNGEWSFDARFVPGDPEGAYKAWKESK